MQRVPGPTPAERRRQTIWIDPGALAVWLVERADGSLVLEGQHLSAAGAGEYAYFITIAAADVDSVTEAFGSAGGGAFETVRANAAALVEAGETTWLKAHGIPFKFFSWS